MAQWAKNPHSIYDDVGLKTSEPSEEISKVSEVSDVKRFSDGVIYCQRLSAPRPNRGTGWGDPPGTDSCPATPASSACLLSVEKLQSPRASQSYRVILFYFINFCLFFFFFFFCHFLGPLLRHMEVPRLGTESEL